MILQIPAATIAEALGVLGIADPASVYRVVLGPEEVTIHRTVLLDGVPQVDGTGQLILGECTVPITGKEVVRVASTRT